LSFVTILLKLLNGRVVAVIPVNLAAEKGLNKPLVQGRKTKEDKMSNMTEVSKGGEIANGTMKEISVEGYEILLARVNDNYYATDNRCPHMGGKLSEGKLEGTVVTCPRHSSQFNLKDGRVVRWLKGSGVLSLVGKFLKSPQPLATYNVKVQDDRVLIEI
jgi:3-phenylpropionate/trans-cinnamate dioxygenase ferredoxin subunit